MNERENTPADEKELRKFRQGAYSDILFVLLPFLAIFMQRLWTGDIDKMLLGAELSIGATVIAGLSISKFIQGLISSNDFGVYKERIVFVIAITLFVVLIPSVVLTMKLSSGEPVPGVIAFVQPLMLVVSISLYIGALKIIRAAEELEEENATKDTEEDDDFQTEPEPFPLEAFIRPDPKEKSEPHK